MGLYKKHAEIAAVFQKHGISLETERLCPMPWSDVYTLFVERQMIDRMEQVARRWHEGQFRKDGVTPYVEHPAAVVKRLESWGFKPDSDGWAVAVAWAHDLIEDTPLEKRAEVLKEIKNAGNGLLDEGTRVIEAVQLLSYEKSNYSSKEDYLKEIAQKADFPVLAVKIADRLCNTLDFVQLLGEGNPKAKSYLAAGRPLFDALTRFNDPRKTFILNDIVAVRAHV